jgi:hypothetical protein
MSAEVQEVAPPLRLAKGACECADSASVGMTELNTPHAIALTPPPTLGTLP